MAGHTGVTPEPSIDTGSFIARADHAVLMIEQGLNMAAAGLIIFLVFFCTAAVGARYLFNSPLKGYEDFAEMIMAVIIFFGLSYTQWAGEHVRLEVLIDRIKGRLHEILEFISIFLALFVFSFITAYCFKGTLASYEVHDVSLTIYWPIWPAKLCLAIGSLLLCARFVVQLFQHAVLAISGIAPKKAKV